jgi:septum formation protein
VALRDENQTRTRLNVSEVEFGEIAADQLEAYCRSGEPADKAGAYAIQGRAALFVVRLHGSYSGVMGLPLFETGELLREAGLTLPDAGVRPLQP